MSKESCHFVVFHLHSEPVSQTDSCHRWRERRTHQNGEAVLAACRSDAAAQTPEATEKLEHAYAWRCNSHRSELTAVASLAVDVFATHPHLSFVCRKMLPLGFRLQKGFLSSQSRQAAFRKRTK